MACGFRGDGSLRFRYPSTINEVCIHVSRFVLSGKFGLPARMTASGTYVNSKAAVHIDSLHILSWKRSGVQESTDYDLRRRKMAGTRWPVREKRFLGL